MAQSLRIVFAGTPEFAAASLSALLENRQHQIIAVYTQPDRPAGRGRQLTASPVKQLAESCHIPVLQPLSLRRPEAIEELRALAPDLMIVAAYGLILPQEVLDIPRLGCINVHASLLPRWRGAAPIQRAILAGDQETGITIMQMDAGLDTGAMLYKVGCPITQNDNAQSLHDRLASLGGSALLATIDGLTEWQKAGTVQNPSHATYAAKLCKEEGLIDWHQAADQIARRIRAFNPWPVASTSLSGHPLRLLEATVGASSCSSIPGTILAADRSGISVATGDGGSVLLTSLQLPGGKAMSAADLLNSKRDLFQPGTLLG